MPEISTNRCPELGFIDAPSNRASNLRGDQQWLDQQLANPESLAIIFIGDRPAISVASQQLTIDHRNPKTVLTRFGDVDCVLLHINDNNQAVFAIQLDAKFEDAIVSDAVKDTIKLIDLRSLAMQAVLPSSDLGTLAQARSLLSWHQFHQFCANCGTKTQLEDGGYRRDCKGCEASHFPRVDPVVIMLIQDDDRFLMGRGHNFEENHFSALAGFLEPGETIEAATRRETFEETGIEVGDVTYLLSQPWPFPSTLMIGVIGQALTTEITCDPLEIAEARWFSFDETRQMLKNNHPQGTTLPPPMSIAYQMLQSYLGSRP